MQHKPANANTEAKDPHRALRLVVVSMGIVLIAGTILLFVLAFDKMQNKVREETSGNNPLPYAYRDCESKRLTLPGNEALLSLSFDDGVTSMISRDIQGITHQRLIHACSGQLIAHHKIDKKPLTLPDAAPQAPEAADPASPE